jgi:hypothetical protein
MPVGQYAKAIVGAVLAGGMAVITALEAGRVEGVEWATVAGTLLLALGAVFAVPNMPDGVRRYGKAIVGGLVAAVGAAGTALVGGWPFSPDEWLAIVVALVSGLGLVAVTPNAALSDVTVAMHANVARHVDL